MNPNAKAIQLPRAPSVAPGGEGPAGAGAVASAGDVEPKRRQPAKRKAAAAAEAELVPDDELPPREMPVRAMGCALTMLLQGGCVVASGFLGPLLPCCRPSTAAGRPCMPAMLAFLLSIPYLILPSYVCSGATAAGSPQGGLLRRCSQQAPPRRTGVAG